MNESGDDLGGDLKQNGLTRKEQMDRLAIVCARCGCDDCDVNPNLSDTTSHLKEHGFNNDNERQ